MLFLGDVVGRQFVVTSTGHKFAKIQFSFFPSRNEYDDVYRYARFFNLCLSFAKYRSQRL